MHYARVSCVIINHVFWKGVVPVVGKQKPHSKKLEPISKNYQVGELKLISFVFTFHTLGKILHCCDNITIQLDKNICENLDLLVNRNIETIKS